LGDENSHKNHTTPLKNNSIKIFIAIIFHQFIAVITGDKINMYIYMVACSPPLLAQLLSDLKTSI